MDDVGKFLKRKLDAKGRYLSICRNSLRDRGRGFWWAGWTHSRDSVISSEMIQREHSANSTSGASFPEILRIMKQNNIKIIELSEVLTE
jgi:hypothetical protein